MIKLPSKNISMRKKNSSSFLKSLIIQKWIMNKIFKIAHKNEGNKSNIKNFLRLISTISMNHHIQPIFFKKTKKILTIYSNIYKLIISNGELFTIYKQSKQILLFLLKSKIVTNDEIIFYY